LGEDFEVRARQSWVVQILDNLVNNACYWLASTQSEAERFLQIVLDRARRQVLIIDSGPGVHEEAQEHLFEPFFSMKGGGTGLGLYISKEVMKRISGNITLQTGTDPRIDSRFSIGACFVLDFENTPRK
jgi:C4-dicarboxylate-specific signal transduction histidine kinase